MLPISKVTKKIYIRNKVGFSAATFINEISEPFYDDIAEECVHDDVVIKSNCVNCLTKVYNQEIKTPYNNVYPVLEKVITVKDRSPWLNGEILTLKRENCNCNVGRGKCARQQKPYGTIGVVGLGNRVG